MLSLTNNVKFFGDFPETRGGVIDGKLIFIVHTSYYLGHDHSSVIPYFLDYKLL